MPTDAVARSAPPVTQSDPGRPPAKRATRREPSRHTAHTPARTHGGVSCSSFVAHYGTVHSPHVRRRRSAVAQRPSRRDAISWFDELDTSRPSSGVPLAWRGPQPGRAATVPHLAGVHRALQRRVLRDTDPRELTAMWGGRAFLGGGSVRGAVTRGLTPAAGCSSSATLTRGRSRQSATSGRARTSTRYGSTESRTSFGDRRSAAHLPPGFELARECLGTACVEVIWGALLRVVPCRRSRASRRRRPQPGNR